MRALLALFALSALAAAGDVVQLTPDNFVQEVGDKNYDVTLVKFYAPWCGHCKAMAEDYETAATQLKKSHPKVKLAEFDGDAYSEYSRKYDVEGYPTLKLFRKGNLKSPENYEGARTLDGIIKGIAKATRPPVTEFATQDEMKKAAAAALADSDVVITGAFPGDGKDLDAFRKFVKKGSRSYTILLTPSGAAEREVTLQAQGADEPLVYNEPKFSAVKLSQWAKKNRFGPYTELTQENYKDFQDRKIPIAWTFVDYEDTAKTNAVHEVMKNVGKKFMGKISAVHVDGVKYPAMAERHNLFKKSFPALGMTVGRMQYGYDVEGSVFDANKLESWIAGVLDGTVRPYVRSQDTPKKQPDEDGVHVLTANTLIPEALESGKDVMVEFYAPWCGHCQALAPEYSEVAKAAEGNDKLLIAKFDGTINDLPMDDFELGGYPTLYFIKATPDGKGRGKWMEYKGARDAAGIKSFIKDHATNPVELN